MRAALLCLFAVLLTATVCQSLRNACVCLKISSLKLHPSRIAKYRMQNSGLCHITAAVLTTVRGQTICGDPNKSWVIKAMKEVDAKSRILSTTARPMSTTSESTMITTAVTWPSFCCLNYSAKDRHVRNIVDCKVQRAGLCPLDAIIIKTRKGRKLCYDPQAEWVVKNVEMNGTSACDVTLPKKKPKNPGKGRKCGKEKREAEERSFKQQ